MFAVFSSFLLICTTPEIDTPQVGAPNDPIEEFSLEQEKKLIWPNRIKNAAIAATLTFPATWLLTYHFGYPFVRQVGAALNLSPMDLMLVSAFTVTGGLFASLIHHSTIALRWEGLKEYVDDEFESAFAESRIESVNGTPHLRARILSGQEIYERIVSEDSEHYRGSEFTLQAYAQLKATEHDKKIENGTLLDQAKCVLKIKEISGQTDSPRP